MTITREQVADLRLGDVVELTDPAWPDTTIRGPLRKTIHGLCVAALMVIDPDGEPFDAGGRRRLTVVSRAPRPLYVNSDRTEPVPGDVVRDDNDNLWPIWVRQSTQWAKLGLGNSCTWRGQAEGSNLRLLVDGATGQAVTS